MSAQPTPGARETWCCYGCDRELPRERAYCAACDDDMTGYWSTPRARPVVSVPIADVAVVSPRRVLRPVYADAMLVERTKVQS